MAEDRTGISKEENEELLYLEKLVSGKMNLSEGSGDEDIDQEIGYVTAPLGMPSCLKG